mgnify:CR=1 FL=1
MADPAPGSDLPALSFAALLAAGREALGGTAEAALTARTVLAEVSGRGAVSLLAHPNETAQVPDAARYRSAIARLAAGEPIAYVLGCAEFYGRRFAVSPATLIPRDDTGALVEAVLGRLGRGARPRILELGTGTGIVAVTLALECAARGIAPEITASDLDPEALAVAQRNAAALGARGIAFLEGDWWTPVFGSRFEVIVSNPPYVETGYRHLDELAQEPQHALVAGPDGLDALRCIASGAPRHLEPGGFVAVEHGAGQADAVADLFAAAGLEPTALVRDLAGRPRVTVARHRISRAC